MITIKGITHLYNAMPAATHREPPVPGVAADSAHVDEELEVSY